MTEDVGALNGPSSPCLALPVRIQPGRVIILGEMNIELPNLFKN